jgi:hypothetical protein
MAVFLPGTSAENRSPVLARMPMKPLLIVRLAPVSEREADIAEGPASQRYAKCIVLQPFYATAERLSDSSGTMSGVPSGIVAFILKISPVFSKVVSTAPAN